MAVHASREACTCYRPNRHSDRCRGYFIPMVQCTFIRQRCFLSARRPWASLPREAAPEGKPENSNAGGHSGGSGEGAEGAADALSTHSTERTSQKGEMRRERISAQSDSKAAQLFLWRGKHVRQKGVQSDNANKRRTSLAKGGGGGEGRTRGREPPDMK